MSAEAPPPPVGEPAFGDEHLARLETLLAADPNAESAMRPDAMQAFFCALAIGPEPPPTRQAVADALDDVADEDVAHDPELVLLCRHLFDDTVRGVRDGTLTPILREGRRGRLDYASWCIGFLEGALWWDDHWPGSADPDEVDELLYPIRVAGDALAPEEKRALRPAEWRRVLLDSERALRDHVMRLRDYWAIARTPPQTLRREGAKVGRNDPCPCGSGRKYKHCHGAA